MVTVILAVIRVSTEGGAGKNGVKKGKPERDEGISFSSSVVVTLEAPWLI